MCGPKEVYSLLKTFSAFFYLKMDMVFIAQKEVCSIRDIYWRPKKKKTPKTGGRATKPKKRKELSPKKKHGQQTEKELNKS